MAPEQTIYRMQQPSYQYTSLHQADSSFGHPCLAKAITDMTWCTHVPTHLSFGRLDVLPLLGARAATPAAQDI